MKKFLGIVVLLVLFAYALFKGVVWYRTSQILSQPQAAIQDKGVLQWDSIGSSVAGQLSIYGLSYQHFSLTQPLTAHRVTFETGSPSSLLDSLTGNMFPQQWQLTVTGLEIALEKRLTRDWVAPETVSSGAHWFAIPCGDHSVGLADLVGMGIQKLGADLTVTQSRAMDNSGGLRAELDAGKLGSAEVTLPGLMAASPALPSDQLRDYGGRVDAVLRDGGFMRRLAAWCAAQSDATVDSWAQQAAQSLSQRLKNNGYSMSRQLQALYKVWVRDGGELRASLLAGEPMLGLPVRAQSAETAMTVDGVNEFEVFYNGARVPDLFLSALPADEAADDPNPGSYQPAPVDDKALAWRPASLDDADRWRGRDVRVTLVNDRVVEGKLSDIDGRQLEVTRIIDGGELAYPLARKAIQQFEVWRRVSDKGQVPEVKPEAPEVKEGASAQDVDSTTGGRASSADDQEGQSPSDQNNNPSPDSDDQSSQPDTMESRDEPESDTSR